MAKLNVYEKAMRKEFMTDVVEMGGMIRSYPAMRVTVAVVPAIGNTMRARYARVSVAQCSEQDKFKRKRGELIAAERMVTEQFFSVPVDGRALWEGADSVAEFLGN